MVNDPNNLLKFGNRMDIRIRLPTRDVDLAKGFLKDPGLIVESTYDKSRCIKTSDTTWKIHFADIPIPGIDVVSPEIEIDFRYINNTIVMASKSWNLKGNNQGSSILKDAKFMKSFDFSLTGGLEIEASGTTSSTSSFSSLIIAKGFVNYQAQGEKPGVFQRAPAFLLDGTIGFIQSCVADFVTKRFSAKLLAAFTTYCRLQQQQQQQQQQQAIQQKQTRPIEEEVKAAGRD